METNIQKELKEIKDLLKAQNVQQKEILTVEEVCLYLELSSSCIYKLTSKKEIPSYSPGGKKIYFKKSEIDKWVFDSKIETAIEVEEEVEAYLQGTNND